MRNSHFIIFNRFIAVIISLASFAVMAEKSHQQKYEAALGKQMQVKCHVEYQGGGDDIRFVAGSFNKPQQAMRVLQGNKVVKHNGQTQKTIYQINE